MTISPSERSALERMRAAELSKHDKEIAKFNARIRELEDVNTALGKAIGFLRSGNEQEPRTPPTPASPSPSRPVRTNWLSPSRRLLVSNVPR